MFRLILAAALTAATGATAIAAPDCNWFVGDVVNVDQAFGAAGASDKLSVLEFDETGATLTFQNGATERFTSFPQTPPGAFYTGMNDAAGNLVRYAVFDISEFVRPGVPTYFLLFGDEMYWPICAEAAAD